MFIRKAALDVVELGGGWQELVEVLGDWIIDWRWLATREEGNDGEEPPFISECALIH